MGQDASAIKQEIAQTRERMGDTVEALAYKADVPSRVKESVQDRVETVKDTLGGIVENVRTAVVGAGDSMSGAVDASARTGSDTLSRAGDTLSRTREKIGNAVAGVNDTVAGMNDTVTNRLADVDVPGNARRAVGMVQENPIGLALGALAIGFVTGSMLPVSEAERRRLKPIGEKIAVQAQAATSDLIEAGKAVAIETAQTAVATALSSAKSHGTDVVDAAKARADA